MIIPVTIPVKITFNVEIEDGEDKSKKREGNIETEFC